MITVIHLGMVISCGKIHTNRPGGPSRQFDETSVSNLFDFCYNRRFVAHTPITSPNP